MNYQENKEYFEEAYKTRYKRLKEAKRCVMCTNQDERTLRGFTRCQKCAEKDKVNAIDIYIRKKNGVFTPKKKRGCRMTPEEKTAYAHRKYVERRDLMKAQSRCYSCGEQDERTILGYVLCENCTVKAKVSALRKGR